MNVVYQLWRQNKKICPTIAFGESRYQSRVAQINIYSEVYFQIWWISKRSRFVLKCIVWEVFIARKRSCGKVIFHSCVSFCSGDYWSMVGKREARILLECFIVQHFVPGTSHWDIQSGNFTNAQNCQLCISIYLQFPSLLAPFDVSKCEITCRWLQKYCISRLRTSLVQLISNDTTKTRLNNYSGTIFVYYPHAFSLFTLKLFSTFQSGFSELTNLTDLSDVTDIKIFFTNKSDLCFNKEFIPLKLEIVRALLDLADLAELPIVKNPNCLTEAVRLSSLSI